GRGGLAGRRFALRTRGGGSRGGGGCRGRPRRRRRGGLGRIARHLLRLELALAVQLVQQRLEFGLGDLVAVTAGRRRFARDRRLAAGRQGIGLELALAMQLVEQRLELGVGDLVAVALGSRLGFAGRLIDGVEQAFEFSVGEVRLLGILGGRRRCRRSGDRLGGG